MSVRIGLICHLNKKSEEWNHFQFADMLHQVHMHDVHPHIKVDIVEVSTERQHHIYWVQNKLSKQRN